MPLFRYEKEQNPTKHTIKTILGTYSIGWSDDSGKETESKTDVEKGENNHSINSSKDDKEDIQSSSCGEKSKVTKEKEPFLKVDITLGGAAAKSDQEARKEDAKSDVEKSAA